MGCLMRYEVRDNVIIKSYNVAGQYTIPYTIANEVATLKELKETIILLSNYKNDIKKDMIRNTIYSLSYLSIGSYFTYSYITDKELLKILLALFSFIYTANKLHSLKDCIDVKNMCLENEMHIMYRTNLYKNHDETYEKTLVYISSEEDDAERRHSNHLIYLREELENEKNKLFEDGTYSKEYKII